MTPFPFKQEIPVSDLLPWVSAETRDKERIRRNALALRRSFLSIKLASQTLPVAALKLQAKLRSMAARRIHAEAADNNVSQSVRITFFPVDAIEVRTDKPSGQVGSL